MRKELTVLILALLTGGCTSFRTTALQRAANDSVAPEVTNKRLRGLPVKLKVPSHVMATVYEQQVILANSSGMDIERRKAATDAAVAVQRIQDQLTRLSQAVPNAQAEIDELSRANDEVDRLKKLIASDDAQAAVKKKSLDDLFKKNLDAQNKANTKLSEANFALLDEPAIRANLQLAEAAAKVAARNAAVGYTLISFTPAQFTVETELLYTDKVFLVDLKRPAGGVLDLKEASMDEEQYFSKIKAEVEERTLADISEALQTITDPVSNLFKSGKANQAIPTSAATPTAESNSDVNFQKSVVATQRFDISEPGWEERLQAFVNAHLCPQPSIGQLPLEIVDGPTYPY